MRAKLVLVPCNCDPFAIVLTTDGPDSPFSLELYPECVISLATHAHSFNNCLIFQCQHDVQFNTYSYCKVNDISKPQHIQLESGRLDMPSKF